MNIKLMGIEISCDTFVGALDKAFNLINGDKVSQVVTINPEMYAEKEINSEFEKILSEAELIVPDGIGIKIGLKFKGHDVERVPGVDFARTLIDWCAKNNKPVAIIGAREEVVTKAVENLKNEVDKLNIVYYHNGYFDDDNEIYEMLKECKPKLVLVALGSPKQEFFIYNAKNILSPCLMIGIGGSLDVWSGNVKRAPKIYRKIGLEWLYRTICQPNRFKRIFPAIPKFLWKVVTYKEDK